MDGDVVAVAELESEVGPRGIGEAADLYKISNLDCFVVRHLIIMARDSAWLAFS